MYVCGQFSFRKSSSTKYSQAISSLVTFVSVSTWTDPTMVMSDDYENKIFFIQPRHTDDSSKINSTKVMHYRWNKDCDRQNLRIKKLDK